MSKKSNIIIGLSVVGAMVLSVAGWQLFGTPKATVEADQAVKGSVAGQGGEVSGVVEVDPGASAPVAGDFVASKNGTKYFPVTCGSAKTIKEENKVFFKSTSEAESAGYEAAKNC